MSAIIGLDKESWYQTSAYHELDSLPFIEAAVPLSLTVAAIYLAFVLKIGPAIMKDRKPLELKNVLLAYNAFQVAISAYLVYLGASFFLDYGLFPTKCFADDKERRMRFFNGMWLYTAAKVTELLDTVFFVLRKKSNQVSLLHVYHHTIMMVTCWIVLKFCPHEIYVFVGTANGVIHTFMYGYYGLSAMPGMEKYLWWKKYLTTLQLIQFVLIFIHHQVAASVSECPPSTFMISFMNLNNFLMILLFGKFYVKSYIKNGGLDVKNMASSEVIRGSNGKEIKQS